MNRRFWWQLALALPLVLLAGLPATADAPPPMSANVIMTDTGFNPVAVTIQPGGSVTFTNQGKNVHTATAIGGAPLPFNTGGIGPGQTKTLTLGIPGDYYYTSATDCKSGNVLTFPCSISFLISVTNASAVATSAAATAISAPPTQTPTATLVPSNLPPPIAYVNITDAGFDPANVTVALEGSVMFTNAGSRIHTATSEGYNGWKGFDSGGLAPSQAFSVGFAQPGTSSFTSSPDCLNGNSTPGFNCTPGTITVSTQALPQATSVPTAAPTPIPTLAAPNPNPQVIMTDGGFS
ncbi:MAG TPA: hypothetical protein VK009_04280, partial [Chloroflexota bacterium]|nr:hypothetical protein [Chloroflexota bacterium]